MSVEIRKAVPVQVSQSRTGQVVSIFQLPPCLQ